MENPQHNVDPCINSALIKIIEEDRHSSLFCQSVFNFVDGNTWYLRGDIMVTKKLHSINEVIELAKNNSILNTHLERPKLKNNTYASPHDPSRDLQQKYFGFPIHRRCWPSRRILIP